MKTIPPTAAPMSVAVLLDAASAAASFNAAKFKLGVGAGVDDCDALPVEDTVPV
jgi:hypothetical protein